MTEKEAQTLKKAYEDVVWMAIRYANGRMSTAPSIVRHSVRDFQSVFPDWKPRYDHTIADDTERIRDSGHSYLSCGGDFLDDLVEQNNQADGSGTDPV